MTDGQPPSRATLVAAWATAVVTVTLALEATSFLAVSATRHEWFTYGRLERARIAVAAGAEEQPMPSDAVAPPAPAFVANEVIHPYLGFALDRSFSRCRPELEGNRDALEYGFPCSEAPLVQQRKSDAVVVAVLGGSVAAAFPAYGTRQLIEELQRVPRFANRRIRIASLGTPGYKQPQQLMTLSYFLMLGAEFDVVINLDGFNEVALPALENIPKGVFPFFPRSWYFRTGSFDPGTRRAAGEVSFLQQRRVRRALGFSRAPWKYSAAASLLWTVLDRGDASRIGEVQATLRSTPEPESAYVTTGPRRHYASEEAMYGDFASVWQRSSLLMHQLARANGATYFHFLQPNQYVTGSKPFGEEERRRALQDSAGSRRPVVMGYPLLRANGGDLARAGVHFHDMTRVFAKEPQPLYVDDCCHLNPEGYDILAHAMGRAIGDDLRAPGP